jgi:hypothetical protein
VVNVTTQICDTYDDVYVISMTPTRDNDIRVLQYNNLIKLRIKDKGAFIDLVPLVTELRKLYGDDKIFVSNIKLSDFTKKILLNYIQETIEGK